MHAGTVLWVPSLASTCGDAGRTICKGRWRCKGAQYARKGGDAGAHNMQRKVAMQRLVTALRMGLVPTGGSRSLGAFPGTLGSITPRTDL